MTQPIAERHPLTNMVQGSLRTATGITGSCLGGYFCLFATAIPPFLAKENWNDKSVAIPLALSSLAIPAIVNSLMKKINKISLQAIGEGKTQLLPEKVSSKRDKAIRFTSILSFLTTAAIFTNRAINHSESHPAGPFGSIVTNLAIGSLIAPGICGLTNLTLHRLSGETKELSSPSKKLPADKPIDGCSSSVTSASASKIPKFVKGVFSSFCGMGCYAGGSLASVVLGAAPIVLVGNRWRMTEANPDNTLLRASTIIGCFITPFIAHASSQLLDKSHQKALTFLNQAKQHFANES